MKIRAKCLACKGQFDLTPAQIQEAREVGMPFSPCHSSPSIIVKVTK